MSLVFMFNINNLLNLNNEFIFLFLILLINCYSLKINIMISSVVIVKAYDFYVQDPYLFLILSNI